MENRRPSLEARESHLWCVQPVALTSDRAGSRQSCLSGRIGSGPWSVLAALRWPVRMWKEPPPGRRPLLASLVIPVTQTGCGKLGAASPLTADEFDLAQREAELK